MTATPKREDTTPEEEGVVERAEGTRPCPVCAEVMSVERLNGVSVDVCDAHGIWLDNGELERIVFVRKAKDVQKRMRVQKKLRNKARRGGAVSGGWTFLLDE